MRLLESIQHYPMFLVGTLLFLGFGLFVTVYARRLQQNSIQWRERHPVIARFNLFRRRIYRPSYLLELRYTDVPDRCSLLLHIACWPMMQPHNRSNQSMKPTAPFRNEFSVFATAPCRGLSLSR